MSGIGRLLLTLILTLLTESSVAFISGVRGKRQFAVIITMNILTNPLINIVLRLLQLSGAPYYITVLKLEMSVVFIEGLILKKNCTSLPMNPYVLSFILNLSSFTVGLVRAALIYLCYSAA